MTDSMTLRVNTELKRDAQAKAEADGLDFSFVVRELMKGYIEGRYTIQIVRGTGKPSDE